jgi:hypothetical protein
LGATIPGRDKAGNTKARIRKRRVNRAAYSGNNNCARKAQLVLGESILKDGVSHAEEPGPAGYSPVVRAHATLPTSSRKMLMRIKVRTRAGWSGRMQLPMVGRIEAQPAAAASKNRPREVVLGGPSHHRGRHVTIARTSGDVLGVCAPENEAASDQTGVCKAARDGVKNMPKNRQREVVLGGPSRPRDAM